MASDFSANQTINGLQTFSLCTIPAAGTYLIQGSLTLPSVPGGASANSAVVVVVKKGVTTVYTGAAGATGFQMKLVFAAADVITVVTSSAAAVDQPTNAIKGTVTICVAD